MRSLKHFILMEEYIMAFCPKCGAEYTEGVKFCGKCGNDLSALSNPAQPIPPVVKPIPRTPNFFTKLMDTKDYTDQCEAADIQANKVIAILGYCAALAYILLSWFIDNLLCVIIAGAVMIVPIIMAKNSAFLRHHATQSVTLLLTAIILHIFDATLASLLFGVFYNPWYNQYVVSTIFAWLIHIIVMGIPVFIGVVGIINASKGAAKNLPIIGRLKITIDK